MRPAIVLLALILSFLGMGTALAVPTDRAALQALDKITARSSRIELGVGETVEFGPLQITLKACDKNPPEETPESAAFLQIVEAKQSEAPVMRFSGWMFASSPALSAMEHPVYDILVLDCIDSSAAKAQETQEGTPAEGAPAEEAPIETTD